MMEMSDYLGHDKGAPDREVKPVPTDGHTAPAFVHVMFTGFSRQVPLP